MKTLLKLAGGLFVLLIIIGALADNGGKKNAPATTTGATQPAAPARPAPTPSKPAGDKDAISYIHDHGLDAGRVAANVQVVQIQVGIAQTQSTQTNVNQLALSAQQAHDTIDGIRDNFATTDALGSGALPDAETAVFTAANDLKNAMGALVAYTGSPNPATLAHFTTQYQTASGEWNDGVRTIWRLAHAKHPPVV